MFATVLASASPPTRPNILFIFSDDHTIQAISSYGEKRRLLETPHIDRIASTVGMISDGCLRSPCAPPARPLARRNRTGSTNGDMVSVLDFAQTILEMAGQPQPTDMQGRSLVPLMRGQRPKDWRSSFYYHFYEYPVHNRVRPHEAVVTQRYKLAHFYAPDVDDWELYDLVENPNETKNFFRDPAYAPVVAELKSELNRLRVPQ